MTEEKGSREPSTIFTAEGGWQDRDTTRRISVARQWLVIKSEIESKAHLPEFFIESVPSYLFYGETMKRLTDTNSPYELVRKVSSHYEINNDNCKTLRFTLLRLKGTTESATFSYRQW